MYKGVHFVSVIVLYLVLEVEFEMFQEISKEHKLHVYQPAVAWQIFEIEN